jgi:hypothetical protein
MIGQFYISYFPFIPYRQVKLSRRWRLERPELRCPITAQVAPGLSLCGRVSGDQNDHRVRDIKCQ